MSGLDTELVPDAQGDQEPTKMGNVIQGCGMRQLWELDMRKIPAVLAKVGKTRQVPKLAIRRATGIISGGQFSPTYQKLPHR